jgi:hypothetical protein
MSRPKAPTPPELLETLRAEACPCGAHADCQRCAGSGRLFEEEQIAGPLAAAIVEAFARREKALVEAWQEEAAEAYTNGFLEAQDAMGNDVKFAQEERDEERQRRWREGAFHREYQQLLEKALTRKRRALAHVQARIGRERDNAHACRTNAESASKREAAATARAEAAEKECRLLREIRDSLQETASRELAELRQRVRELEAGA